MRRFRYLIDKVDDDDVARILHERNLRVTLEGDRISIEPAEARRPDHSDDTAGDEVTRLFN